jgi:hypothetical protein
MWQGGSIIKACLQIASIWVVKYDLVAIEFVDHEPIHISQLSLE